MARPLRKVKAGGYYHVLNRGNGKIRIFHKKQDFAAFLQVLAEGMERYPVELHCYCLMGNHWHLLLKPATPSALADLMRWVGVTHVRRHHQHYHSRGGGHLYQGRYKSFPIQDDVHFRMVCRYIEGNPLRAKLVESAQAWPHSSLRWWPGIGLPAPKEQPPVPLADWPVARPRDWLARVNRPIKPAELDALHESVNRGRPFGDEAWVAKTAKQLGLLNTLRGPGRPSKATAASAKKAIKNQ